MIITLTTDFGVRDYYVALLKGAILSEVQTAQLIDISHQIKAHNIVEAAFAVRHCYTSFPLNTVHLIAVDTFSSGEGGFVCVKHNGHFFLAPDNGVLSMVFDEMPDGDIFHLNYKEKSSSFPLKDVFAKAIAFLYQHIYTTEIQIPLTNIGKPALDLIQRISLQPVVSHDLIRGVVTHIDHYDNVVLNIHRNLYERVANGRSFELYFQRHSPILSISEHYHDVPVGDTLCLFNSADYLEIAVNMGNAATLLDLSVENPVQMIFR